MGRKARRALQKTVYALHDPIVGKALKGGVGGGVIGGLIGNYMAEHEKAKRADAAREKYNKGLINKAINVVARNRLSNKVEEARNTVDKKKYILKGAGIGAATGATANVGKYLYQTHKKTKNIAKELEARKEGESVDDYITSDKVKDIFARHEKGDESRDAVAMWMLNRKLERKFGKDKNPIKENGITYLPTNKDWSDYTVPVGKFIRLSRANNAAHERQHIDDYEKFDPHSAIMRREMEKAKNQKERNEILDQRDHPHDEFRIKGKNNPFAITERNADARTIREHGIQGADYDLTHTPRESLIWMKEREPRRVEMLIKRSVQSEAKKAKEHGQDVNEAKVKALELFLDKHSNYIPDQLKRNMHNTVDNYRKNGIWFGLYSERLKRGRDYVNI